MSQTTVKKGLGDTTPDKENMTSHFLTECGSIRPDYTNCTIIQNPPSVYSAGFSADQVLYVVI